MLDVTLLVVDEPTSSDGKNVVVMQFLSSGRTVQFTAGETVDCNGVALAFNGLALGYAGRATVQPVGGAYKFNYTRQGVTTTVSLPVPQRPVFTSPAAGASVARGSNLTLHYVAGSGTGVDAGASDKSTAIQRNVNEPDNGTYTGLDVTGLSSGPGSVSLTRTLETAPAGTGFHSLHTTYNSIASIAVTWI